MAFAFPNTLTGITWDDPRGYGPLNSVNALFGESAGECINIAWDIQPLSGFESRPVEELALRYDLLVLDHPHIASVSQTRCLAPIDGMEECYVGNTLQSYQWAGKQWAVPIDAACHVAAFREGFMPTVPHTWEEVIELANSDLRVALPLSGVHSLMALLTMVASQGVSMSDPVAWIDTPAAEQSLNLLKRLCHKNSGQGLDWNPIQALQALSEGACDYVPLTFGYAHWQARKVCFGSVPSWGNKQPSRSVLGGAGIAVSAYGNQQDLAMRYARLCASSRVQTELWALAGGQPAHSTAWNVLSKTNPFYRDTQECVQSAFLRPRHPAWNHFQSMAGTAIETWLRDAATTSDELQGTLLNQIWQENALCIS